MDKKNGIQKSALPRKLKNYIIYHFPTFQTHLTSANEKKRSPTGRARTNPLIYQFISRTKNRRVHIIELSSICNRITTSDPQLEQQNQRRDLVRNLPREERYFISDFSYRNFRISDVTQSIRFVRGRTRVETWDGGVEGVETV